MQKLLKEGYQVPGFPRSRFHILKLKEQNRKSEAQLAESLLGKKVRVIQGKYKGRLGHVSNMRQDLCFVALSSIAKKIKIHKDSLRKIDGNHIKVQASLVASLPTSNDAARAAGEETGMMPSTPQHNGDRTPMVLDSGGNEGEDDPWDPDASGYDEYVSWAYKGVVATMDQYGDDEWILCDNATDKYEDERVTVRSKATGQTRSAELSKLHCINPNGIGAVVVVAGDRAGDKGFIDHFNSASSLQTVIFQGDAGDRRVSMSVDDLAVYHSNNNSSAR